MQFANPMFLWALTGLSIPIGIHLLSRKEGKVIKLGSLRHVHETSTQQFRGIRLNEILLLVLRCLLIVLFTLIVSGLHWNSPRKKKWLLIERGLEKEIRLKPMLDSLANEGYESRFLVNDFPLIEDSISDFSSINYRVLIEQLKSRNVSDVIIFAQNRADHFKGLRSTLPANVRWISQPLPAINYTLYTIRQKGDSVTVRQGHTSSEATYFTTEKINKSVSSNAAKVPDTIRITLVNDKKYAYDGQIIKAALDAIRKSFPIELSVQEIRSADVIPTKLDWLIWLSDESISELNSFKILHIHPSAAEQNEVLLSEKNNRWVITKRLNEAVSLQENLTLKLAALLIPRDELQNKANSRDRRMISDSIAWSSSQPTAENAIAIVSAGSANPYLILLLLLLLVVERTIAYRRNQ